jgi:hypothetical protein
MSRHREPVRELLHLLPELLRLVRRLNTAFPAGFALTVGELQVVEGADRQRAPLRPVVGIPAEENQPRLPRRASGYIGPAARARPSAGGGLVLAARQSEAIGVLVGGIPFQGGSTCCWNQRSSA